MKLLLLLLFPLSLLSSHANGVVGDAPSLEKQQKSMEPTWSAAEPVPEHDRDLYQPEEEETEGLGADDAIPLTRDIDANSALRSFNTSPLYISSSFLLKYVSRFTNAPPA